MAHTTEIMVNGILTQVTEFDHSAQEIDDTVDALGGAKTPQEALANLGAGVRPNLLDNWDFRAGHVVNQRGQTSISKPDLLNDRWRIYRYASGTATLTDNGINLTGDFDFGQTIESSRLPNTPNIPVTISALFSDGTFVSKTSVLNNTGEWETITAPVNSNVHLTFIRNWNEGGKNIDLLFFWISNGSITPVAAKLETGSTQTLAYHKSDGKWELLPQPESDYVTQLRKCQRYLVVLTEPQRFIGMCTIDVEAGGQGILWTPTEMRTAPVITGNLSLYNKVNNTDITPIVMGAGPTGVRINYTATGLKESPGIAMLFNMNPSNPVMLSAEL